MTKNRICDLLGIKYPIIQAPMNWISGADMVAAVSNAGCLGTLGINAGARTISNDPGIIAERLREQVRKVRGLTQKPFAVNIVIGFDEGRKFSERCLHVLLEEKVAIVVCTVGSPEVYTGMLKDAGIKVLHAVSNVTHADKAERSGVDAVICEGYEAGGHKGFDELTTFTLVPMVADSVKIPVIAGGGVTDARGVAAALALGADGVYMGTRFMASRESDAHLNIKEAIIKSGDTSTVSLRHFGMLCRNLKNIYTKIYLDMIASGATDEELREFHNEYSFFHTQTTGDTEVGEIICGQGAGLIKSAPGAAEIIEAIVSDISVVMAKCQDKLGCFQ
ncbi:MAG: nitronate monooxygenase [Deltaproteobacteria bacterium]|nr:nitronate monooxygenase [Deltaproteobacteria bacterium]